MKNTLLAASIDFSPIIAPILEILNAILWPAIAVVVAVGSIYCIVLGVKIAQMRRAKFKGKSKEGFNRSYYRLRDNFRSDSSPKNRSSYLGTMGKKSALT